jgi:hypothetical protein
MLQTWQVELVYLAMSCDRALAVHWPKLGIAFQYLPASLCHGVAIDWVWSRIILRKHRRDTVLILHADVFPVQRMSVAALLRQKGGGDGKCHVTGRRWTRCYSSGPAGPSPSGASAAGGTHCEGAEGPGGRRDGSKAADGDDDGRVCMWHFDTGALYCYILLYGTSTRVRCRGGCIGIYMVVIWAMVACAAAAVTCCCVCMCSCTYHIWEGSGVSVCACIDIITRC